MNSPTTAEFLGTRWKGKGTKGIVQHRQTGAACSAAKMHATCGLKEQKRSKLWVPWPQLKKEINRAFARLCARRPGIYNANWY
jgi:hypothetical protein